MIGIVDYDAGNIASVANALAAIDAPFLITNESALLAGCNGIILPGVGAAPGAMESLQQHRLTAFLAHTTQPLLGICLGMQLLYRSSEEGSTPCLGVLPGTVKRFPAGVPKVPHIGWNNLSSIIRHPLLDSIQQDAHVYYAHSYYADTDVHTIATTTEGITFSAIIQSGNFYGVQFHPEKSGQTGLTILNNFTRLCSSSRQ